MSKLPVFMEGWTEFYPFCFMLIAADTALDAARMELPGRNYHYVTAVTFSAFAVEAAVNHVGIDYFPEWMAKKKDGGHERKPWNEKLELLTTKFGMPLDFTTGAAKTVKEAFEVRDKLAHGKTWVGRQCYLDDGHMGVTSFPDWLAPCLNESRAKQVIDDARTLIGQLLDKAGYQPHSLYSMGQEEYRETAGPACPAAWKAKGTK
jgi:hypothetical protein